MTPLSEIAADVAQALGLDISPWPRPKWRALEGATEHCLDGDGSNLTDAYWRCRCEDWLLEQGWQFDAARKPDKHRVWPPIFSAESIDVGCPWPEAPARLVSAVWRRINAKQSA